VEGTPGAGRNSFGTRDGTIPDSVNNLTKTRGVAKAPERTGTSFKRGENIVLRLATYCGAARLIRFPKNRLQTGEEGGQLDATRASGDVAEKEA